MHAIESPAYHPGVKVRWQSKAWADSDYTAKYLEEDCIPFVKSQIEEETFVLFMDYLGAQRTWRAHDIVRRAKGQVVHGPKQKLRLGSQWVMESVI